MRPASDGINALTYGTGDGLSEANAWAGVPVQASIAPGDTVCLPGEDEPFFTQLNTDSLTSLPASMTSGTLGSLIRYKGCAATVSVDGHTSTNKARVWRTRDLSSNRSFDSSRNLVTGAAYEWASLGSDIYRKRIDYRIRILWQDETWLKFVSSNPVHTTDAAWTDWADEAAVLAALQPGQWANRDFGDGTLRVYYRATSSGENPTNTTIRCDALMGGSDPRIGINVTGSYITVEDVEVWGATSTGASYSVFISNVVSPTLRRVGFFHNEQGPTVQSSGTYGQTPISDVLFEDLDCCLGSGTGVRGAPGARGLTHVNQAYAWIIRGGHYDHVYGTLYSGKTIVVNDGDGIGIGFTGSTVHPAWSGATAYVINNVVSRASRNYKAIANHTNQQPPNATYWVHLPSIDGLLIENITANYNYNYGIYNGTTSPIYNVENYMIRGLIAVGNGRGCFTEGADAEILGTFTISGFLCGYNTNFKEVSGSDYFASMTFVSNLLAEPREIIVENGTFVGNNSDAMLEFRPNAHNNFHFKNLAFVSNPGRAARRKGDLYAQSNLALIGDEEFKNISFYSLPNQAFPFANLGGIEYDYDSANLTAFNAAANGATGTTLNVDPLLVSIGTTCTTLIADYNPPETSSDCSVPGDSHTQTSSPLRNAGVQSATCRDVLGVSCAADTAPDIGGYQGSLLGATAGLRVAGAFSHTSTTLIWTRDTDPSVLGYRVYRRIGSGETMEIATVTPATAATAQRPLTQYSVMLPRANTYYFSVAAFDVDGTSALSTEVSVTVNGMAARSPVQ